MSWRLTVRTGGRVEHARWDGLDQVLDALEARARELMSSASAGTVDLKLKRIGPAQQVVARLELAGPERWFPSVKAGIDIHGDGSAEAFRGGVRRVELEQRQGENAFAALRHALSDVLVAAGGAKS